MFGIKNIAFLDVAVNGTKAWFYNIGYDAIFEIDLETGAMKLESFLPEYTHQQERFAYLAYYNNRLYLAPRRDTRICIYSFEDKSYEFIELDLKKYGYSNGDNFNLFCNVFVFKNNIYFFPGRFHSIVKLNPEDNSLTYLDAWYDDAKRYLNPNNEKYVIFNNVHIDQNGHCILASWTSNFVLEYDLVTNTHVISTIEIKETLSDSLKIGNNIYCMAKNSSDIYIISDNSQTSIKCDSENNPIYFMYDFQNIVVIIPLVGVNMLLYDLNKEQYRVIKVFKNDIPTNNWHWYKNRILCAKKIDNKTMLLYENNSSEILMVNVDTQEFMSLPLSINDTSIESIKTYKKKMIAHNADKLFEKYIINENEYYNACDFIELITTI